MKSAAVLFAAVVFFLLGAVASSLAQSDGAAPPPGVSPDRWVPISDVAGVVLIDDPRPEPEGLPPEFRLPADRRRDGVLMVIRNGDWIMFERLGELSPRVHQLR